MTHFQVFMHCVRNQTDGTDQEEQGCPLFCFTRTDIEDSGYRNAAYDTNDEPKVVRLHQESPILTRRAHFRDSAKRSLERYKRAKGKDELYNIQPDQSSLQGSARKTDPSDIKGAKRTLNNIPTSEVEREARVNAQTSSTTSLRDAVVVVNGESSISEQKSQKPNEEPVPAAVHSVLPSAPPAPMPSSSPYVLQVRSPQRAVSNGSTGCDVDGVHEEPPHHRGSKPRRVSDASSAAASIVPGLNDSVSADVINIRL